MNWVIDWLEQKNKNEVRKLKHEMNCALLDYMTPEDTINLHWDQAFELQKCFAKSIIPWEKYSKQRFNRSEFNSLKDQWKEVYGDPSDPEVKEKIDRTTKALLEMNATAGKLK